MNSLEDILEQIVRKEGSKIQKLEAIFQYTKDESFR
jgi:hypothetical protein